MKADKFNVRKWGRGIIYDVELHESKSREVSYPYLPAGVTRLKTGLADMERKYFTHCSL